MGRMIGVYCCGVCDTETECEWTDLNIGQVFQCPNCKTVYGHVVPKRGGRAWVKIRDEDVKFYRLLDEPSED
jgi:hypothetical protein